MKWPMAIIVSAAVLGGCRSSQPAANPFFRTTVPPPPTGQGAVVVQGDPYNPSGAPPGVTAPAPMLAPPAAAPPAIVPPRDNRYTPPAGSFQYNQSSLQRSVPNAADEKSIELASYLEETEAPNASGRTLTELDAPAANTVQDAMRLIAEPTIVALSQENLRQEGPDSRFRQEEIPPGRPGEPPERVMLRDRGPPAEHNTIRVVGSRGETENATAERAGTHDQSPASPVFHITVEDEQPSSSRALSSWEQPSGRPKSVPDAEFVLLAGTTLDGDDGEQLPDRPSSVPEVQSFSSGGNRVEGNSSYSYSTDYTALRGRLEYSQAARQWKLRYIPIDGQTDRYGGSVVLTDTPQLKSFAAGEFVAVRGGLSSPSPSGGSFSPLFRLDSIEPTAR